MLSILNLESSEQIQMLFTQNSHNEENIYFSLLLNSISANIVYEYNINYQALLHHSRLLIRAKEYPPFNLKLTTMTMVIISYSPTYCGCHQVTMNVRKEY